MNFDDWWNKDYDDSENPFEKDSFGYWAFAGWCAALAQSKQEPVALKVYQGEICYMSRDDDQSFGMWCPVDSNTDLGLPNETVFYTAPFKDEKGCAECGVKASDGYALYCVKCNEPLQKWIGLTDVEIAQTVGSPLDEIYLADFRKVIAKLYEKNT